ncbi:MAG: 50S ribosome-binding GTPase, partial [Hyphomicrobiales bacterium]|nr:50S ribosome-binding GTPase [Hyphomicrobiales bacterium]
MFTIAILGRPNVGKSSLFNRLAGRQKALVHPTPGVSRDWREGPAQLGELRFNIIDTPGLEEAPPDSLVAQMSQTAKHAAERADLCIMLVDARAGVLPEELHFAKQLRQMNKPVLLAANKCEGGIDPDNIDGIWEFGLGEAIPLSAAHGEGLAELHNAIIGHVKEKDDASEPAPEEGNEVSIAIIGRPNVGKSSLVNKLVGEERMLTGDTPGITRDAIDVSWEWNGQKLRLVDTAGMRRPSRIEEKLEQ